MTIGQFSDAVVRSCDSSTSHGANIDGNRDLDGASDSELEALVPTELQHPVWSCDQTQQQRQSSEISGLQPQFSEISDLTTEDSTSTLAFLFTRSSWLRTWTWTPILMSYGSRNSHGASDDDVNTDRDQEGTSGTGTEQTAVADSQPRPPVCDRTQEQQSSEISDLTPEDSSPLFPSIATRNIWRRAWVAILWATIVFLLVMAVVHLSVLLWVPSSADANTPIVPHGNNRTQRVRDCASKLSLHSHSRTSKADQLVREAIENFFLTGAGENVDPWDCEQDGSFFTIVYALIAIREFLQVRDPSWHPSLSQHTTAQPSGCSTYSVTTEASCSPTNATMVLDMNNICNWKRITCSIVADTEAKVALTGLTLNHDAISGTIPPEIQWLASLRLLKLYSNSGLFGTIPSQLQRLSYLETLEVHQTGLSGTVPTSLGRLSRLESFRLYSTNVTGRMPDEVCALRQPDIGQLIHLEATCRGPSASLLCSCCTKCRLPALAPTLE